MDSDREGEKEASTTQTPGAASAGYLNSHLPLSDTRSTGMVESAHVVWKNQKRCSPTTSDFAGGPPASSGSQTSEDALSAGWSYLTEATDLELELPVGSQTKGQVLQVPGPVGVQDLPHNVVDAAAGDEDEDTHEDSDIGDRSPCKYASFRTVNVCKNKRARAEQVHLRVCKAILDDPEGFDMVALKLPHFIKSNEILKEKLLTDFCMYQREMRAALNGSSCPSAAISLLQLNTPEKTDRTHIVSI